MLLAAQATGDSPSEPNRSERGQARSPHGSGDLLEPDLREPEILEPKILPSDILEPDIVESDILEPSSLEPDILQPSGLEPDVLPPETLEPSNLEPDVLPPETLEPSSLEPDILPPDLVESDILEPDVLETDILPPDILETEILPPGSRETRSLETRSLAPGLATHSLATRSLPPGTLEIGSLPPGTLATGGLPPGTLATKANAPDHLPPGTDSPDADSPDTGSPDTDSPDTGSRDADSPDTDSPDTDSPDTDSPDTDDDVPEIGATVVTGLRLPRPSRDVPAAVTVLDRAEIRRSPRRLADDLLRTVPSAATFRRSSSLAADPSSQGVNLRGVGPSGVSRALVLLDGVPVNDPFGGWVYWRALPLSSIESVEIAPGGASALFGNFALGGVVQLLSREPDERRVEATVSTGSFATHRGAARVSERLGPLAVALDADALDSEGYTPIAPAARGAIDGPAASRHLNLGARIAASPPAGLRVRGHARFFGEALEAGTRHTSAGVWTAQAGVGLTRTGERGVLEAQVFGGVQRFRQTRARVAPDRADAEVAARQRVPSSSAGGAASFQAAPIAAAGEHVLLAGVDALRVVGSSREVLSPPSPEPGSVVGRTGGGEQRFLGVFAQDAARLAPSLHATAALRLDVWGVVDAERTVAREDGDEMHELLASRSAVEISPRVGLLWRPFEIVALRGSGFRAFRAPTLNELYRPFQVGTVLTESNPALEAETLIGAEAGPEVVLGPAVVRTMGFWNRIDQPIQNVTLPAPLPGGATRQRQNLGRARVAGLEIEASVRPSRAWIATAGYTFVDPTVTAAPGLPELVGRVLAQAPRHRLTATVTFDDPAIATATVSWRLVGAQFEDDLNTRRMPRFATIDALAARRLWRGVRGFVTAENLLDREYLVGRAGVDTVGQPRTVQIGVGFEGG